MSPFFPPSRPRRVSRGIKARSSRGSIGESWWSRRFVDVLESFALGSRMTRGRSYARAGQVVSLDIAPGRVTAAVQGSRARPYSVTIGLARFAEPVWERIETTLAEQALYSARLLAGDLPPDLEQVFADAGAPLFPASVRDLDLRCSCPDWEVPCKHLAATCYLLAEVFDTDPFQILHWRGRSRETLLGRLRELRNAEPPGAGGSPAAGVPPAVCGSSAAHGPSAAGEPAAAGAGSALADLASVPLADCADRFWLPAQPLPPRPPTLETDPDLVLRQLPAPGPGIGGPDLVERLRPAYQRFGARPDVGARPDASA